MAGEKTRRKVKIEIYETDLPILAAFAHHAKTNDLAEAWSYAFEVFNRLTERIKELEQEKTYIASKTEAWNQAQLRRHLPFYG